MMSPSYIRSMQDEAAIRASDERRIPLVLWDVEKELGRVPFLGDYTAPGWRPMLWADAGETGDGRGEYSGGEDRVLLFVDSSGFGADDEPALSMPRAMTRVKELNAAAYRLTGLTVGWALWEVGQFQVHIAAYVKLDAAELAARS